MNKRGIGPIGFKGVLQAIGPELISNVLNRMKGKGGSGGEGRGISANGHTRGRISSCHMFVREGIKEKGGESLTL